MKKECENYAKGIAEGLYSIYNNGVNEDEEEYSLYDYISNDVLDFNYITDSNKEYDSCILYVTIGGPTCYIDTFNSCVICSWGSDKAEVYLPSDIRNKIDSIMEEYYNC